jgi:hypothetical protein
MQPAAAVLSVVFLGGFVASYLVRDRTTGLGRASVLLASASVSAFGLYVAAALLFVWPLSILIVGLVVRWWVETAKALRWMDEHAEPGAALLVGEAIEGRLLAGAALRQGRAEPPAASSRCRLCRLTVGLPGEDPVALERPLHPRMVRRLRHLEVPAPIRLRVLGDEVAVDWPATGAAWSELDPTTARIAPT